MDALAPEAPLESPDALEGGLRIAFGPPNPPSRSPGAPSVLARLATEGVDSTHVVLLRDEPSAGGPLVIPTPAQTQGRAEGRYQVLGEIARGGVGVVLKGRDVDLGRDVAMKVLRDEHAQDPDVIRRFVEEAQIGGQLQHPGIVPVYEMGVRQDRRPYFTMKLIKGRTLAALLGERADPTQDRRRFLAVFESVCQTIAYAHARGVIHRDLKPANVMVGAFGEVLVVDWGMGKVLASGGVADERRAKQAAEPEADVATVRSGGTGSDSVAGSVMGTPRYMAPEQARGAIEELDERVDVFALGAILCEILTGKPPYSGSPTVVLSQAARGDVEEALQRLEAADVEADLAALVRACLARDLAARPRDAGAVAQAVGVHLASLEERAAAARTEAAEARVKAAEERKRRRLTLALSGAVLGLVLLGGGGWLYFEQDRRSRAAEASRAVGQVLDEATSLQASAAAADDVGRWKEALSAARRAESLARSSGADEGTRARALRAVNDLEQGHEAARGRAAVRARDGEMAAQLEAILQRMPYREIEPSDTEKELEQAFTAYGIAPGTGEPADLAARIRTSPIADPLLRGLDAWVVKRRLAHRSEEAWMRLLDEADADPWRRKLRAATTLEACRALVSAADVDALPRRSLAMLCPQLSRLGDGETAYALAKRAQARYPGDRTVLMLASIHAYACTPPHTEDAVRFATAALALVPESWSAHEWMGTVFQQKGDLAAAVEEQRESVRLRPESSWAHERLATMLVKSGDQKGALREARESVRLAPDSVRARNNLGAVLIGSGDFDAGIAECREVLRRDPSYVEAHLNLGSALLAKKDLVGALAENREAARLAPENADARAALGYSLLGMGDPGAVAEYRAAVRVRPGWAEAHFRLGMVLSRAGDFPAAVVALREAVRLEPSLAPAHAQLASTLVQVGDHAGAVAASREAIRLRPDDWLAYYYLATALQDDDVEGAVRAFREAARLRPEQSDPHLGLGLLLPRVGDFNGGVRELREALRLRPPNSAGIAEALREAEGVAVLASRLDGVLAGTDAPAGPAERATFGWIAQLKGWYAAASALYLQALADDAGLASNHRYNAVCSAALAGTGKGKDADTLDDAARSRWRVQALAWLRAELDVRAAAVEKRPAPIRASIAEELAYWKQDRDLAGIRDDADVARLSADEQKACHELWRDVTALIAKARAAK